ncbi:MAG: hypothetical protein LIO93_10460 [Bacteroidales bacterium]|nr:hypothetical protein [Bacteroidales bacterium]
MKIIYNKYLPIKGFVAINLFGLVLAQKSFHPLSKTTINHERIHTQQMKEMLYIFFYIWYLIEWMIKLLLYGSKSYYNLSFEREARENEQDMNYSKERKPFSWIKYLSRKRINK